MLNIQKKYRKIRKAVWWLSVDNFFVSYFFYHYKIESFIITKINNICKRFQFYTFFDIPKYALDKFINLSIEKLDYFYNVDLHMTNSYRGLEFLLNKHINAVMLSEYLNQDFLTYESHINDNRENIIAYNPSKGYNFTKRIIEHSKKYGLKYVRLERMSRETVIDTLKTAKVYIDFGNHPGKDRLPREAAILGCCVITGKRGSANCFKDVSIPSYYKFEDNNDNIPLIVERIIECMNNYEEHNHNFNFYRKCIRREAAIFLNQVKNILNIKRNDDKDEQG